MYLQVKGCKLFVNISTPNRGQQRPTTLSDVVSYLKGFRCALLMHGFPDTADMWVDQIAAVSAAGFAVIAPDMPGYGKSTFENPNDVKQYSLRNIVAIMCGMLDQLGVQKTTVVGHDWGAAVAWTFAMQAPQRITELVVLSVGHPGVCCAVHRDVGGDSSGQCACTFQLVLLSVWRWSVLCDVNGGDNGRHGLHIAQRAQCCWLQVEVQLWTRGRERIGGTR